MSEYPTRPRSHTSTACLVGLLLHSFSLITLIHAEQLSQALTFQPCTNNAPVTNECVEAGLRQQREAFRKLPEYHSERPESHLRLAELLMQQGDPNGAIEEYQAALRLSPNLAVAYRNMGAVYLDKHEWQLAEEALTNSVRLKKDDGQTHYWLGRALLAQQQFAKAQEALSRSTKLDDRSAEGFSALALAHMAQGHFKEAEDALRRAIQLKPDLAEAHHRLEVVYSAKQDPKRLKQSTQELLAIYFRRE